jgi:hypothetical protein
MFIRIVYYIFYGSGVDPKSFGLLSSNVKLNGVIDYEKVN